MNAHIAPRGPARRRRRRLARGLVAALALLAAPEALAAPLHPWGGQLPPDRLAMILYQNYALTDRNAHSKVWLGARINDHFDYAVAQALIWDLDGNDGRPNAIVQEFLARYFPVPGLAIAARMTVNAGEAIAFGPELHYQQKWGRFMLTVNAGLRPPMQPEAPLPGLLIVAPELFVHPRFSVYLEADAIYDFRAQTTTVFVTPGLSALLNREGTQLMSLGCQVGAHPERNYLVAAWYFVAFGD